MNKIFFIASLFLGLLLNSCQKSELSNDEKSMYHAELSEYAKGYMKELKGVLLKNMKDGGPLQAVNVCSDTAADLSESFSKFNNIEVKRVSFKNRNPNNAPDEFESKALRSFETLKEMGELASSTDIVEKFTVNGVEAVRFVKPIMVDAPCLNCHGSESQISDDVKNVLKSKYPDDKATDYNIGDLRGAISITKILSE
jgi:hypothetical protein